MCSGNLVVVVVDVVVVVCVSGVFADRAVEVGRIKGGRKGIVCDGSARDCVGV